MESELRLPISDNLTSDFAANDEVESGSGQVLENSVANANGGETVQNYEPPSQRCIHL